jgi:hypothetical protein
MPPLARTLHQRTVGFAIATGRSAQITKGVALSKTSERILIAILLIVAMVFAMHDAHAARGQLPAIGLDLSQNPGF